ncbi:MULTISPECIES: hypothetical protein [Nostocales]|uniref:Uncharacterized protein n=3 Tax=Nostocales TaxID=1161 RepID=A0A8S9T0G6_9CYAN|nr:hypothetical protein [Tolypothrix bouteillei]KAF3885049.1 hypothetical protein DA73_0400005930 [Tolypothrix bouteillei VB521301]
MIAKLFANSPSGYTGSPSLVRQSPYGAGNPPTFSGLTSRQGAGNTPAALVSPLAISN